MRKVSFLLLIIFALPLILSACTSDSKELDDQVYALVIGADKGVDNKVRLTVQFPTYKGGGGGDSGGKKESGGKDDKKTGQVDNTIVVTIEAPSILEGINLLNTTTSRKISLVHLKTVVFSEDFARDGIGSYLEPIARFRETRRILQIAVCRGNAEDYIKENKTLIGESVSKAMELMTSQSGNGGFFPRVPFKDFYRGALSPYCQAYAAYVGLNDFNKLKPLVDPESPLDTESSLLPGEVPRTGDLKREMVGTALFDGDRMVGNLNSYETRYFLMVNGQFQKGIFTVEDKNKPGTVIPFDLRLGRKPRIKVDFENGIPVITIVLNIEADVGAIQSRITYEDLSRIEELNNLVQQTVQNGVKNTIEKTQKEFGVDIFGFGYKAAHHFFTIKEFEKYNWLKHYKEAKVDVKVEANVRRTGLMSESAKIRNSKDEVLSEGK